MSVKKLLVFIKVFFIFSIINFNASANEVGNKITSLERSPYDREFTTLATSSVVPMRFIGWALANS